MKKIIISVFLIIVFLSIFFITSFLIKTKKEPVEDQIKILFIGKSILSDYWVTIRRGAEVAAKDHALEINYVAPDDINDLKKIINESLNKDINGVVLSSTDFNAIKEDVTRLTDNNVFVLVIDEPLDWENISGYISIDNVLAGELIAGEILKLNNYKSKVAIINSEINNVGSQLREESIIRTLSQDSQVEIVATVYCEPVEYDAYQRTLRLLNEYPEITSIAAPNLIALEGAVRAVYETDRDIKLFGLNNSNYLIDMCERDIVAALIVQPAFNMGYIAVNDIVSAISGKKIEKQQIMSLYTINKHNIYTIDNQRLLFPVIK